MEHYLNVCDIKGDQVEPVDLITFGSPCQDLSVAGKRKGLNHSELGDDETTRSGLFVEAVRIIKEMRENDRRNGRTDEFCRPFYAVWENVPGALSSNKGEDFRVVLELLARVKDKEVSIPLPKDGKWSTNGAIDGEGWSIAWRVIDAQYWGKTIRDRSSGDVVELGTPQRRRRIYLVTDFRGKSAKEVLFKCESLQGNIE